MPAIVHIIIVQATQRLAEGTITRASFDEQISRIGREELGPMGLTLLVRDLLGGRTRFLIKEKSTGLVREMIDFASDGNLERQTSGEVAPVTQKY